MSYGEVLVDKGAMYIRVTILRAFDYIVTVSFGYILYCVLICTVVVLYCFVMCLCVCVCVWVL